MRWFTATGLLIALLMLVACGGGSTTYRSMSVQAVLTDIHKAALKFENNNGYWPPDVEVLEKGEYITIKDKLKDEWRFDILSEQVTAVSRPHMPDGEGHEIVFDFNEDRFYGYGVSEEGGWR